MVFMIMRKAILMNKRVIEKLPKEDFFEEISRMFYNRNFGTKTKVGIELVMFKYYFEAAKDYATKDGELNENLISDYKIGCDLGISPTKVRNLRLKVELQLSDDDYDWQSELLKVLSKSQNLEKSKDNEYIQITIRSQKLFYAVEDWIEDNGKTLDITLNTKQLKVPKKSFYKLLNEIKLVEGTESEALKKLERKFKIQDYKDSFIDGTLKGLEAGSSATEIIECISGTKVISNAVSSAFKNILNLFQDKSEEEK